MKIRELNEAEIKEVSGGLCEGLSIPECFDGTIETFVNELKDAGRAAEEARQALQDWLAEKMWEWWGNDEPT